MCFSCASCSGNKTIYFRETEILEAEWEFLNESAETIRGGDLIVAEQFWSVALHTCGSSSILLSDGCFLPVSSLTKKLMGRVINYFETQLRVPTSPPRPQAGSSNQPAGGSNAHNIAISVAKKMPHARPPAALRNPHYEDESSVIEAKLGQDGKVVATEKIMTPEERIAWFSKVLDAVRMRYRKLQRFAR